MQVGNSHERELNKGVFIKKTLKKIIITVPKDICYIYLQ